MTINKDGIEVIQLVKEPEKIIPAVVEEVTKEQMKQKIAECNGDLDRLRNDKDSIQIQIEDKIKQKNDYQTYLQTYK